MPKRVKKNSRYIFTPFTAHFTSEKSRGSDKIIGQFPSQNYNNFLNFV